MILVCNMPDMTNVGENKKFESACKWEDMGVQFEYTAPGLSNKTNVLLNGNLQMLNREEDSHFLRNG